VGMLSRCGENKEEKNMPYILEIECDRKPEKVKRRIMRALRSKGIDNVKCQEVSKKKLKISSEANWHLPMISRTIEKITGVSKVTPLSK
jgi:hypothetical protein